MAVTESASEVVAMDLARECLYRFLSAVVAGPYESDWARAMDAAAQNLAKAAADLLRAEFHTAWMPLAKGELPIENLDLAPLVRELNRPADELRADFDRTFGLVIPKECPPYETEYYPSKETFARSQQMADIAGFYRAFGIEPAPARPERADHLALELEFMAFVIMKKRLAATDVGAAERIEVCERAGRDFFRDHLAWWIPAFARGLERKAGGGYLAALARVLAALVPAERSLYDLPDPAQPVQPELIERPDEQTGCAACPLNS
jgi:TorA maturation chaperone TorD